MGDQTGIFLHNQDLILSAEQLLMFDAYHDEHLLEECLNETEQDPGNNVEFAGTQYNIQSEHVDFNCLPHNPVFGNPKQIPIWPILPSPYTCTCCQTLREFCFINGEGTSTLKLEVHGRLGLICHAVQDRCDILSQNHEYCMFDFCQESISSVKQFLVQYCDDRKREGYIMLQDPLSNFYNTLCIGLVGDANVNGNLGTNVGLQQTSIGNSHLNQNDTLNPQQDGNILRPSRNYLSEQRERAGKMKLSDLSKYFHLRMSEAAKQMNICQSVMKSICRKEGMTRWPHTKIKSIKSKISKKRKMLDSSNHTERADALAEINELEQRLADIYAGNVG